MRVTILAMARRSEMHQNSQQLIELAEGSVGEFVLPEC